VLLIVLYGELIITRSA